MAAASDRSPVPHQNDVSSNTVLFDISLFRQKALVMVIAIVMQMSYVLISVLEWNYGKFLWCVAGLLLSYNLWRVSDHDIQYAAVIAVVVLILSALYDLIDFRVEVHVILVTVIQVATLLVGIVFALLPREWVLQIQLMLLACPFLSSVHPPLIVVVYTVASLLFIVVDFHIDRKLDIKNYTLALLPLVRLPTALMLVYFAFMVTLKTAALYGSPLTSPSIALTPPLLEKQDVEKPEDTLSTAADRDHHDDSSVEEDASNLPPPPPIKPVASTRLQTGSMLNGRSFFAPPTKKVQILINKPVRQPVVPPPSVPLSVPPAPLGALQKLALAYGVGTEAAPSV
jgi:hypothetical protein